MVSAATHEDLAWLETRSGAVLTRHATGIKALDAKGNVRGVVGFDDAAPASIRAHMAVDTAIVWRSLLPAAFAYVFEQLGKAVLVGTIRASNRTSMRLAKAAGMYETHRIRDGWAVGEDLCVYELRREQRRWLGGTRKVHHG